MAKTPQSFEKRQRERSKQRKREEKLERRLIRSEEKRLTKSDPNYDPNAIEIGPSAEEIERERERGDEEDE